MPTVSQDECNSAKYFAGTLPDDAICGYISNNKTTCYVSSLFNNIMSLVSILIQYFFLFSE